MARTKRMLAVVAAGALAMAGLGACGDDDNGSAGSAKPLDNRIEVEMKNYAFAVDGELTEGLGTVATSNTSDEFHMVGFGRIKPGKTFADVEELLKQMSSGGGEGGEGDGGGEGDTTTTEGALAAPEMELIAQTSSSTSTSEPSTSTTEAGDDHSEDGGDEGEGGEGEGEDPMSEVLEELGAPGHLLAPGETASITTDNLEAGSYAMICFLPTPEGQPHFAKGMYAELEVKEGDATAAPKGDAKVSIANESVTAPDEVASGDVTFEVEAEGDAHEFTIVRATDPDATYEEIDRYFTETFEESDSIPTAETLDPDAPAHFVAFFFDFDDETVWAGSKLKPGTYWIGCAAEPGDEGGREHGKTELKKITVT